MSQNISLTLFDTATGRKVVLSTNIVLTEDLVLVFPENSGNLITEDSITELKDGVAADLGTLNKLALAINNDKNFYATVMGAIGNKLDSGGNAPSASKLLAPVTIAIDGDVNGSASFDGSGNITIHTTVGANSIALGNDTTGNYVAGVSVGTGLAVDVTSGEGISPKFSLAPVGTAGTFPKVTTDAYGRVTAGALLVAADIPALDASKITTGIIDPARLPSYVDDVIEATSVAGFPATGENSKIYVDTTANKTYRWTGTVYIEISPTAGNADSATKLATARTITVSGDATGSASFDGTSNITLNIVINPDSVALGTDTTGNYVAGVSAGTGISITNPSGEGVTPAIGLTAIGAGGTAAKVTFDAYGRVTGAATQTTSDVSGLDTALAALKTVPQLAKSTAYTLALSDGGSSIDTSAAITIPLNSAVGFPIGTIIGLSNLSAAAISLIPTAGVTLILAGTTTTGTRTLKNYATGSIRKVGTDTWLVSGSGIA